MYERQVFKDGIRRTITTKKGSKTARYFEKHELEKLFRLAPAGECEMLEKFQGEKAKRDRCDEDEDVNDANNKSFVVGASGKPSFLEVHPGVVGLSSHDHLYSNAEAGGGGLDDLEPQTPFASTPFNKPKQHGRAGRVMAGKTLDFGATAKPGTEGSKVQMIPLGGGRHAKKERRPLVDLTSNVSVGQDTVILTDFKPRGRSSTEKENTAGISEAQASKLCLPSPSAIDLKVIFETVDRMIGEGDLEKAMGLLMDELDNFYEFRDKDEKVQIHKKISHLGVRLSWL